MLPRTMGPETSFYLIPTAPLDVTLSKLETLDPRAARVVELRFFGGLQEDEVAEVLGVSVITVKRDWKAARAWLAGRLQS